MATVQTWRGVPHKYTLKEALDIGPLALQKLDTQERAELAQFLHNQFNLRVNSYLRTSTVTIPFAFTKLTRDYYEETMVDGRPLSVASRVGIGLDENVVITKGRNRMLNPSIASNYQPHNALISYIIMHQNFFKAKTSTLTGWRDYGLKEDIRLFGTKTVRRRVAYIDENGKRRYEYRDIEMPKYRLTDDERRMFWRVYEEIRRTGWTSINEYSSEEQQEFAAVWMSGQFDHTDIERAYQFVLDKLDKRPRFLREKQSGLNPDDDPFTNPRGHVSERKEAIDDEFVW